MKGCMPSHCRGGDTNPPGETFYLTAFSRARRNTSVAVSAISSSKRKVGKCAMNASTATNSYVLRAESLDGVETVRASSSNPTPSELIMSRDMCGLHTESTSPAIFRHKRFPWQYSARQSRRQRYSISKQNPALPRQNKIGGHPRSSVCRMRCTDAPKRNCAAENFIAAERTPRH